MKSLPVLLMAALLPNAAAAAETIDVRDEAAAALLDYTANPYMKRKTRTERLTK